MSNIRRETKIIQSLLKEIYPNKKFSIQLKQPSSYVSNSDKIKIKCPEFVDVNNVITELKKYVHGIDVYEKGSFGYISHINNTPYIEMSNGDKVDMDMVEFIEVGWNQVFIERLEMIIIFESELQENINDTILKKYKNLIKKLSIDNRVLCICKDNENGEYYLEECCDNYFRYTLTKEDCLQLAKLFNEIANTIEY